MSEPAEPSPRPTKVQSAVIDGSILAGAGLVTYGAWLVYHPAAALVGGALLIALGIAGARR